MDSVRIVGLRVHRVTMDEALATIEGYISSHEPPRHVVTADASMAVIARQDPALAEIVEQADLVTPDGFGILKASKMLGLALPQKVSGVDLVGHLCRLSASKGYRLFFLGAAPGVAEEAARKLTETYPGAHIVGARDGYFKPEQEDEVVAQIREARPDVLFVAFGIPKQEKWIRAHRDSIRVPVSIGIGGSFDVYSGRVRRAPVWMQNSGLEWLHRLASNPKKISKVATLPKFVLLAVRQRFSRA